MTKQNDYITIVKTYEFYLNEKKYHLDAVAEIDSLLRDLPALPPGFDSYDVGGTGSDTNLILEDDEK